MIWKQHVPEEQARAVALELIGPTLLIGVTQQAILDHQLSEDPECRKYQPIPYPDRTKVRVTDVRKIDVDDQWSADCNVEIELEYSPRGARAIYGVRTDAPFGTTQFVLFCN